MNHFLTLALSALNQLHDFIEKKFLHIDCEIFHNKLLIEINTSQIYIITIHESSKQIWLSSPISGSHQFFYDEDSKQWLSIHNQKSMLSTYLFQELSDLK